MQPSAIHAGRASAPAWRLALSVLVLLLSSCITLTPHSQRASAGATVIPNVPMQKWGIESCGAGSLSTILQHYGDSTPMQQWDATLPKTRGGVLTIDMLLAARQKGFDAQLVTGSAASVSDELRAGRPVILMLQVVDSPGKHYDFFHYIVADGFDADRQLIRTQWGDRTPRWVSFAKLEQPWKGGGHAAILIRPPSPSELTAEQLRPAVALEEEGKYAEAAALYRDLLSHHPASSLAWTNLGNTDVQLGKRAEAESDFRRALDIDPAARDALNNLAWLLLQQQRVNEAETYARRAVATSGPDSYLVLDTLARVLAAKGDCGGATKTFLAAIDDVPTALTSARDDLTRAMADAQASCGR